MDRRTFLARGLRGLGVAGLGVGATRCGEPPRPGMLVYTSIAVDIVNDVLKPACAARCPDLAVTYFASGSEALIRRIETERQAGGIQADVVMLADPSYYMTLKMRGDLAKYESPEARTLPTVLKDPDGYFAATRIIDMVLVHNTRSLPGEQAPQNWPDLADARFARQIVISSPRYSGSTYATVATLAQRYGWEYFRRLRANHLAVIEGTQGVERSLAAGEYKAGIGIDYAVRQGQARGSPLDMVVPADGAVVLPSPIGLVKKRDRTNLRAAQEFYDFMLSPEGQEAIVKGVMVPVRPDVARPPGMPSAEAMLQRSLPIDWVYLATGKEEVLREWRSAME